MKSWRRNKTRKEVPTISLWGIDEEIIFNAIHFNQLVPENLPQFSPHKKNQYVTSFIVKGNLKSFVDFKEHDLSPGYAGLVNPNQIHWIEVKQPQLVEAYIIAFNKTFLKKLDLNPHTQILINAAEEHIGIDNGEHSGTIRNLFQTIVEEFHRENEKPNIIIRKLMEALFSKFDQLHANKKPSIKKSTALYLRFLNALEKRVSETHRVSQYAAYLETSEKSINRACQAVVQQSAQAVIHQKINYVAKRQLHFSKKSAKEIAYQTGFNDPVQFSKFFKHHNNLTPLEYRKRLFSQK